VHPQALPARAQRVKNSSLYQWIETELSAVFQRREQNRSMDEGFPAASGSDSGMFGVLEGIHLSEMEFREPISACLS